MRTSDALLGIAVASAMGLYAWFKSVPNNESTVEMLTGHRSKPGSWLYRSVRIGRWIVVASCGIAILIIVCDWTGMLPPPGD